MNTSNDIYEGLKCPICIDFAEEPMECLECSNLFCRKCLGKEEVITIKCPMCRKDPNFKESAFAKRLLASIPIDCTNGCGVSVQRGDLKNHLLKCDNRKFECSECEFTGLKKDFLNHIINKHENEMVVKFSKKIETQKETLSQLNKNFERPNISSSMTSNFVNNYGTNVVQRNYSYNNNVNINQYNTNINANSVPGLSENKNKLGFPVSKGTNDVFYCGQKTLFFCGCCDGSCGPDNGCPCQACMEYSCEKNNVPSNSLINNKGRVATFLGGNFYCLTEYVSKSSFFNKAKPIKCQFPGKPCHDCEILTKNVSNYWSHEKISRLR